MISGMVGQQLGMFQGYGGYASGFGPGAMTGGYGMGPSPYRAPPPPTSFMATGPGQHGMYGEQTAMRLANYGRTAGAVGGVGLSTVGMLAGIPMDPLSGALMGGLSAGAGGALGGAALGGAIGLGIYGATKAAGAYYNAFTGGINDQAVTNSVLRNNFNFYGGGGAFGRGFGQAQMGQIGGMLSSEVARSRGVTNMGELNNLVSMGADAGMFTGVRDVQQFTQNFRRMLDTLKNVQRELGGTLTDALQFVRSSQQAGIFQNADRVNFAAEIRTAEAVSGMDRNQLVALAAQGSQISRAYGGVGRQGAMGAVRVAQTLGAAVQSGAINQEMLSEATGGLTGTDAMSAFTSNILSRSGAFSRRAMGRYSLFALSNANGTGLDEDMMDRFRSGDLSVSEVSRAAHRNVGRMGRARALNREGLLRGAVMEEGGLAAQIGMMRLTVGDRVLDSGDDLAQLVMQRRFRMSRSEAGVMMGLMRNQGVIAEQENIGRISSAREVAMRTDIEQNRSFEAFTRNIEHGLSDATGLTAAREMGRRFATRLSSAFERAGNAFLGITSDSLTASDRGALARMSVGRATAEDIRNIAFMTSGTGSAGATASGGGYSLQESLSRRSLGENLLHGMGFHTRETGAEVLAHEGINIGPRTVRGRGGRIAGYTAGMDDTRVREELRLSSLARQGVVYDEARTALEGMMSDRAGTVNAIARARLAGGTDSNRMLDYLPAGMDRRAALAFMSGSRYTMPTGTSEVTGSSGPGMVDSFMEGLAGGEANYTNALNFVASGGHLGRRLGSEFQSRVERARDMVTGAHEFGDTVRGDHVVFASTLRRSREAATRRMTTGERGDTELLHRLRGVNREALESFASSEDFRSRVATMSNLTGNREALGEQLVAAREAAMRLEDPAQQQAALAMYAQMEENINVRGGIGSEAIYIARGPEGRAREAAIRRQQSQTGGTYRAIESAMRNMRGAEGSLSARIGALAGRAGEAFGLAAAGLGTEESDRSGNASVNNLILELAHADRTTSEGESAYRDVMRSMRASVGDDEAGSGIISGISMAAENRRERERALSGRGRRGRRQAIETVLAEATGNTFGSMDFTVRGRNGEETSVSGTRAMDMLMRGGGNANQIIEQMMTSLTNRSDGTMSADSVNDIRGRLESALGSLRDGGRGLSQEEIVNLIGGRNAAGEVVGGVGDVEGMSKVREGAAEDSLQAARASSPLDAERNDLLRQIQAGIESRMADSSTRARENAELARTVGREVARATSWFGGEDDPPRDPPVPPGTAP